MGFQKFYIYSSIGTINIGSIGVLAWSTKENAKSCNAKNGLDLLNCYTEFIETETKPAVVPIENVEVLWRKLHHQYDLKSARQGLLKLPHIYQIRIYEPNEIWIEIRGRSPDESTNFLHSVISNIVQEHRVISDRHYALLDSLKSEVEVQQCSAQDNSANCKEMIDQTGLYRLTSAISLAKSLTHNTKLVGQPTVIRNHYRVILFHTLSGLMIGLIAGLFIFFVVDIARNFEYPSQKR